MIKIEECSYFLSPTDLGRINQLLKHLSPSAEVLSKESLNLVQQRGFIFTARDTDTPDPMSKNGDGVIIGMATIIFIPKLVGLVAQIEDVSVDENYQRQGIAKGLYEKLLALAKERHAKHIDLTCNPNRVAANIFYQGLGFKRRDTNNYRLVINSA